MMNRTRKISEGRGWTIFTTALIMLSFFCLTTRGQSLIKESPRPSKEKRLFKSKTIDKKIDEMIKAIPDAEVAWMFDGCFPNTLDTTVHFKEGKNGMEDDTYVLTGDIPAMWLRDSGAQVWTYLPFIRDDITLQKLIRGVILRQFRSIRLDPYANAFLIDDMQESDWKSDNTQMLPGVWERKYEIDSLCYPLRLAYEYWLQTGDDSIFDKPFLATLQIILNTFEEQQRRNGPKTSYKFTRRTTSLHDTMENYGYGHPAKYCGLIASAFRPSDDSTIFPFLIPSNFFAVSVMEKMLVVMKTKHKAETDLIKRLEKLIAEVKQGLENYAIAETKDFGKVYAYEVDGRGNQLLMDDANAPSLLSLPYLCDIPLSDPIYQNTRRMILSDSNPYFFVGKGIEQSNGQIIVPQGIGSPHTGYDMIWPMSIIMRGLTTDNKEEMEECIQMLRATTGGKGFMHESFHKDNPTQFTRSWFSWANGLFAELVMKCYGQKR